MIDLLVTFIIFVAIVAGVCYVWNWLCGKFELGEPVRKIGLLILGVIALVYFLKQIVQPLMAS